MTLPAEAGPTVVVNSPQDNSSMPGWAIRLEGKVDAYATTQGERISRHQEVLDDHETRLRSQESSMPENAKERLREVENRPTVQPKTLWMALTGTVGIVAALGPIIAKLYA
jgi:hypothetical protein